MARRLLINWVYYNPIGHAIEAYRYAQAFRNADPALEIAVALNSTTAIELGACLPGIDAVFPIDLSDFAPGARHHPSLARLPRDWDFVFTDPRHDHPMGRDDLDRCEQALREHLRAGLRNSGWSFPESFPESHLTPLHLQLPPAARMFADRFVSPAARTRISLLLGSGTEPSRTPPTSFWRGLLHALFAEFEDLEVVLIGSLDRRRSATQGISRAEVDSLLAEFPRLRDGFDRGLLNQLALAERCDLHISPHTGMSFAIQCVGTPWLVLSGADVAEYIVNGVPFLCVYPACPRYPCGPWFAPEKNPTYPECLALREDSAPFPCLSHQLAPRMPEIIAAARTLVERRISYHECVHRHYQAMLPRLGKRDGEPFMEGWPTVMAEEFVFTRSDR
jgi:hypothetical protein